MDRCLSPDSYLPATSTAFQYPASNPHRLPLYADRRFFSPSASPVVPPSPEMEVSVQAVEEILNYSFRNKLLLEEALTHSSFTDSPSYQRLEFVGDMALGLAFTNHFYLAYPNLEPGKLSLLRSFNVSTEKLARVSIKHGFYPYTRRNTPSLDEKVKEFSEAVIEEDDPVAHGGSVKAPKVLADLAESIVGAIYVDINFDLERLWVIFRGLLEPIVTLEDLLRQPQPVTMLFESCQKHGNQVSINCWRNGTGTVTNIYVNGEFIASGFAEKKEISKLNAAKESLLKLSKSISFDVEMINDPLYGIEDKLDIEGAKQKLSDLCSRKKWPKPIYGLEKEEGPPHRRKYVCSATIPIREGAQKRLGDGKSKKKDAENSAASFMIRFLKESNYL